MKSNDRVPTGDCTPVANDTLLTLEFIDSGTALSPITYAAWPGGAPARLMGGVS